MILKSTTLTRLSIIFWKGCKALLILLFFWDLVLALDRGWRKPTGALGDLEFSSSSSCWSGTMTRRSPTPCFIHEFLSIPEQHWVKTREEDTARDNQGICCLVWELFCSQLELCPWQAPAPPFPSGINLGVTLCPSLTSDFSEPICCSFPKAQHSVCDSGLCPSVRCLYLTNLSSDTRRHHPCPLTSQICVFLLLLSGQL